MSDETRILAEFAETLIYEKVPVHLRNLASDILVDQIGVEIGCSALPWAKQVREAYREAGGAPEATVIRYGDRLPIVSTAFINSTFGHSFEYDDGNPLIHGHLGAELVPSLMAVSERHHLSGRDFITAFIAGYEVRGRIAWAVSPDMVLHGGPQYSTSCGPFGVAAAVSRLLGLGSGGMINAMGIAGSFSGGLRQYDQGGGSVKRIFTAIGASSGIQAAQLARAGMTGPDEILEGKRGFLRIYSKEYRADRLVSELGSRWMIDRVYFKPYCCVGIISAAIDGVKKIVAAHGLTANDIQSIEVGYPTGYHIQAGGTAPKDLLGMQFSTAYSLALTVLKGRNTPHEYTEEALNDPSVRAFAAKVSVREDTELSRLYEGKQPSHVHVKTVAGKVLDELIIDSRGSPNARLSSAEVDEKFRSQVAIVLGSENCEMLIRTLRNIETLDDMAKLPPLLVSRQ